MSENEEIEPIEPVKTWTLNPPISYNNINYDSITVQAPTVNQVELSMAEKTEIGQSKKLVQVVANLPAPVVAMLPFYILTEASRYMMSFTSAGVSANSEKRS